MISKCKKNYKVAIVFFVLGIIVSGLVVYAAVIESSNISYDNSSSGLSSTTLKGAIDELYEKSDIRKMGNFVSAYTYNQTTGSSNYCVTGEEETCKRTNCYKIKTGGSCKAGDIIKYKVNDTDIITFHVMFDNGTTITMQSQKNTINKTAWYAADNNNTKGPLTILPALENATSSWSNVNNQTYTMGTTTFKTNAYTGCTSYNSCETNVYTLEERTAKARMITVQETSDLGCTSTDKSCPIWMYNYLEESTSYGGIVNDTDSGFGYWTMTASPNQGKFNAWLVRYNGSMYGTNTAVGGSIEYFLLGARAVVVVSK